MAGLLDVLNNPLMGFAVGLMSGGQPGGTFAGGLNAGLGNMMSMQSGMQRQRLVDAQLAAYERELEADRNRQEAISRLQNTIGTPATVTPYQNTEMFPGEQPIQGLYNATPGTGYLGGQIPPEAFRAGLLRDLMQIDPSSAISMMSQQQKANDVKTVDLGDRVGVIDPVSGQIIQSYAKGAAPSSGGGGILDEFSKEQFNRANTMRDEYTTQSKDFVTIRNAFGKIQASATNPSPAGDLSLIFAYMKILDPTSVVREGEQASARNAAGVPDQIRNLYNRVVSGQQLNPEQRTDFVNRAGSLFAQQLQSQKELEGYYSGLSTRMGVDPQNVLVDVYGSYRDYNPNKQTQLDRAPDAAPKLDRTGMPEQIGGVKENVPQGPQGDGVVIRNGKRYVRVNGQWYEE